MRSSASPTKPVGSSTRSEMNSESPRLVLVLVTGLPGTGKSTMAEVAAETLAAPTLAHDWTMSGLRPFLKIQAALDAMNPSGHRDVGWSILRALARQQIRRGSSVVLDGVARAAEIKQCRGMALEEGAQLVVVMTQCAAPEIHRSRIEGRERSIPNWYELDWDHVAQARAGWEPIQGADVVLDAANQLEENTTRLREVLVALQRPSGSAAPGHPPAAPPPLPSPVVEQLRRSRE